METKIDVPSYDVIISVIPTGEKFNLAQLIEDSEKLNKKDPFKKKLESYHYIFDHLNGYIKSDSEELKALQKDYDMFKTFLGTVSKFNKFEQDVRKALFVNKSSLDGYCSIYSDFYEKVLALLTSLTVR